MCRGSACVNMKNWTKVSIGWVDHVFPVLAHHNVVEVFIFRHLVCFLFVVYWLVLASGPFDCFSDVVVFFPCYDFVASVLPCFSDAC